MTKMYTNKPIVETEEPESKKYHISDAARIEHLENKVRQLTETVNKMASALALNSRQIRRQNTDIQNVNTVIRNR